MTDAIPTGLTELEEPGDAELISAVRGGDLDAYGQLFARHVDAARRLARQLVSAGDVDDLVSEGFSKVLAVLQRGGGPDLAFRAYLLTSVRRLHVDKIRSGARLTTTDDLTPYDPGVEFDDTVISGFENAAAAKAFQSLPERWQQVLWHTEVERQKPADIAPLLGMSANSVSALAYRAREGLRQAFVTMHAQDAVSDSCAAARGQFGAYVRGGVSKRDAAKVEAHLGECRECTAIYLELAEVNSDLGAVLAPIVLGTAGAGYVAAHVGAVAATKGAALLFLGRARDWALHSTAGQATAGVAGAATVAVAVVAAVHASGGNAPAEPVAKPPVSKASVSAPPAQPAPRSASPKRASAKPSASHVPTAAAVAATSATPVASATPQATPSPQDIPVIATPLPPVDVQVGSGSVVIDLTQGAKDPRGLPLTVQAASVAAPQHGTVVIGGEAGAGRMPASAAATSIARTGAGTVTYTPDAGWRGDDRIDYTLTNGHGGTVSGHVVVTTPDAAPEANDDHVTAHILYGDATTVDVLGNDSDPNGDDLSITGVSGATHGSAQVQGAKVVFTPTRGFSGDATFGYAISDGHGGTASATATLTYGMQPDAAPVAHGASASTGFGAPVRITILGDGGHASDPDGDPLTLTADTRSAKGGSVTVDHGTLVYDPKDGFSGDDTFGYTVSDGVKTAAATISVHVQAQPLGLTNTHPGLPPGYVGLQLRSSGIPSGGAATLTVRITGFDSWHLYPPPPASCTTDIAGSTVTVTCPATRNGTVLHADFKTTGTWSVHATLTPVGYDAAPATLDLS